MVDAYGNGKNTVFASLIGSNEANVRGYKTSVMPKFDFLEKIARCLDVDLKWLLTGEGTMLRNSKNSEETIVGVPPNATPISPAEESIIYKMYKDEKEEKERLVKEKETKIDHLQSELLAAREELATLKAKYPESSTSHPEGLGPSETAPHAPSHPHSPTSEHYYGSSSQLHQEKQ